MSYDYTKFTFGDNSFMILRETRTYSRTTSGRNWRRQADKITREVVPADHYQNYITSIPFFNNWGDGASCRANWTTSQAGYLPWRVVTVSPGADTKIEALFRFIDKSRMDDAAGAREKDIMREAIKWKINHTDHGDILGLYVNDDDESDGDYNLRTCTWVN